MKSLKNIFRVLLVGIIVMIAVDAQARPSIGSISYDEVSMMDDVITIRGRTVPNHGVSVLFGNAVASNTDSDKNGDFVIKTKFKYPVDFFPARLTSGKERNIMIYMFKTPEVIATATIATIPKVSKVSIDTQISKMKQEVIDQSSIDWNPKNSLTMFGHKLGEVISKDIYSGNISEHHGGDLIPAKVTKDFSGYKIALTPISRRLVSLTVTYWSGKGSAEEQFISLRLALEDKYGKFEKYSDTRYIKHIDNQTIIINCRPSSWDIQLAYVDHDGEKCKNKEWAGKHSIQMKKTFLEGEAGKGSIDIDAL